MTIHLQRQIDKLNGAVTKILHSPELAKKFAALGMEPVGQDLAATDAYMKSEIAKWAKVVKAANIYFYAQNYMGPTSDFVDHAGNAIERERGAIQLALDDPRDDHVLTGKEGPQRVPPRVQRLEAERADADAAAVPDKKAFGVSERGEIDVFALSGACDQCPDDLLAG